MGNLPELGQIVTVRSRQYVVEEIIPSPTGDTRVRLACLNDDAQGNVLEVFWQRELDGQILGAASWEQVTQRGFDQARQFSAYLHALRWNCVTSTEPKLFQAPYRAGIEVKSYQLEPLRKALKMPRVNLFIADDVGLGKTIEAGLILRELLLRQKVKSVVISCPPSVVDQWKDEMESRFGLTFIIFDRDFVATQRRERGYGINPWKTHNRFIISHALLRDEVYAAPLRDWLGVFAPGSLLILDEAHNAAPASSSRYAVDSHLTRTIRDIAPRFEHRLFLSATPHNGHSNSFAALLEILDPQRFCRGVPVRSKKLLDAVMVRRLKQDLREINNADFPLRVVCPILIEGLPEDAPELRLAELLQVYRLCREERLKSASRSTQATSMLVITSLQKRLLSSIEAFASTLKRHRRGIETQAQRTPSAPETYSLLWQAPGADDERAELDEQDVLTEELAQMERASGLGSEGITAQELALLNQMTEIAEASRSQAESKVKKLGEWIQVHLCPDLGTPGASWRPKRVLIFTEYADTKRYLEQQLQALIAGSDQAEQRIGSFHGGMSEDSRRLVKEAFNRDPEHHPLRILIATDAAREGVNLQNYCADLFHYDVPWNPSRMEQRNGRIDRKLQREPEVRCYYFVLPQRPEDRVMDVLVQKTQRIQAELGSLSLVVEKNFSKLLEQGIRRTEIERLGTAINHIDQAQETDRRGAIQSELEAIRLRQDKLRQQQQELERMLLESQQWLGLDERHFREALSVSLELMGAKPLQPESDSNQQRRWTVANLAAELGADASWAMTLDSLRQPRVKKQKLWEWRQEAPIRPVVFEDPGSLDGEVVHLHLEHRLVQRLLGRFLAQGFAHHELNRACVCRTENPIPRVLILGRLSLYGERAARLHDEIITVAAEWTDPKARGRSQLRPLTETEKKDVLEILEDSLARPRFHDVSSGVIQKLQAAAAQDVEDLRPHLDKRAQELAERAKRKLSQRGEAEAQEMQSLLTEQRQRILKEQTESQARQLELFSSEEVQQIEADRRHWQVRLGQLEVELIQEPERIRQAYGVKAERVEPVGLIYLWPISS